MYAELMGNHKKCRIKSRYGNKIVVEGRMIYDCFVLNEKANAVYYHGGQLTLQNLIVQTSPGKSSGQTKVRVQPDAPASGNTRYYQMKANASALTPVKAGEAVTTSSDGWTALSSNDLSVAASTNKVVAVVEVDSGTKAVSYGIADINAAGK